MRELVTDLEKIRYWGERNYDKNFDFRSFLKGNDSIEVDLIAHKLDKQIRKQIDCTSCGNCCIELKASVTDKDVARISESLGLSDNEFVDKYIDTSNDEEKIFAHKPCKFLKDRNCTIYDVRPKDCISYPHTQKKNFTRRLIGVIENYSVCPIVFNLVEQLKIELEFK